MSEYIDVRIYSTNHLPVVRQQMSLLASLPLTLLANHLFSRVGYFLEISFFQTTSIFDYNVLNLHHTFDYNIKILDMTTDMKLSQETYSYQKIHMYQETKTWN